MQGWIKLDRSIQEHWLYQEKRKFSRYEAWIDLLMLANYKDNKFMLGNELIEVKAGSFVTSELKLMARWDWGKAKLRTFLEMLENEGMIVKKSDRKKTTITICNYSVYQESEKENRPQTDHVQTMSEPQTDTTKKERKIKNSKEVNSNSRKREVYDEASIEYQLSKLLFDKILENNPSHKKPNLQEWSRHVRLMLERDNRTQEQIRYVIEWAQNDSFWCSVILSTKKLREKFDTLTGQIKTRHNKVAYMKPKESMFAQPEVSKQRQAEREEAIDMEESKREIEEMFKELKSL